MPQVRHPIRPGCWRQGKWIIATKRVGAANGKQRRARERFPIGTDDRIVIAWQLSAESELLLAGPVAPERDTLAADIGTYLAKLPQRDPDDRTKPNKYWKESTMLLGHWAASPIGAIPTDDVTRDHIVEQLKTWADNGIAIDTRNKRFYRLRVFFMSHYGIDAPNPTDKIKGIAPPEPEPRDFPVHIVNLIIESLADQGRPVKGKDRPTVSFTKIRLAVMAWTGAAPATLQRVTLQHLDLDRGLIYLTARRKGRGTPGKWLALLPPGVDALRAFVAAGLLGKRWSNSSVWKTWQTGIARATKRAAQHATDTGDRSWLDDLARLPPKCRPYDVRHCFGAEVFRQTKDLATVAEMLQHAKIQTSKRYGSGALSEVVAAAVVTMTPTYTAIKTIPAPLTAAERARAALHVVSTGA